MKVFGKKINYYGDRKHYIKFKKEFFISLEEN